MVAIIVALVSIAVVTAFMWWANGTKFLPFQVCAICAGTAGTWIWLLIGIITGLLSFVSYMPVIAILMGGSVVGIAYQGEKYLKSGRSSLLWKATFIPLGFGTVWSVTHFAFGFVILGVVTLIAVAGFFLEFPASPAKRGEPFLKGNIARVKDVEEKMKDCC